jgi:hypothetical protein
MKKNKYHRPQRPALEYGHAGSFAFPSLKQIWNAIDGIVIILGTFVLFGVFVALFGLAAVAVWESIGGWTFAVVGGILLACRAVIHFAS